MLKKRTNDKILKVEHALHHRERSVDDVEFIHLHDRLQECVRFKMAKKDGKIVSKIVVLTKYLITHFQHHTIHTKQGIIIYLVYTFH